MNLLRTSAKQSNKDVESSARKECCSNNRFQFFEYDAAAEDKDEDKMEIKNKKVSIENLKGMKMKEKESRI